MNVLLDTHTILWWLAGAPLADEARELIEDGGSLAAVSAATVWEIAVKRTLGKVTAPEGFAEVVLRGGFEPLAISHEHAERAGSLPMHHRDPFDRMLVAQAQLEGLTLLSRDPVFALYDVSTLAC
jgi:PIN domain nuclease of toxin-antitoxin system